MLAAASRIVTTCSRGSMETLDTTLQPKRAQLWSVSKTATSANRVRTVSENSEPRRDRGREDLYWTHGGVQARRSSTSPNPRVREQSRHGSTHWYAQDQCFQKATEDDWQLRKVRCLLEKDSEAGKTMYRNPGSRISFRLISSRFRMAFGAWH